MIAIIEENPNHTPIELWRLKNDYCYLLRSRKDFAAAETSTRQFLAQAERVFNPYHPFTLSLLRQLAAIHQHQHRYHLAQLEYEDLLGRAFADPDLDYPNDTCVYALRGLAQIRDKLGDAVESERNWRAALTGAIKEFGREAEETMHLVGQIEQFLARHGVDCDAWIAVQDEFGVYGI